MNRGRGLIFAQVVVSAIALAVVYVTLLRPDDGNPLFGVETPSEATPADPSPGNKRTANKGGGQGDGSAANGGGGTGGSETLGPGALLDGALLDAALLDAASPPGFDPGAPPAFQYRNTLSQIRARLDAG